MQVRTTAIRALGARAMLAFVLLLALAVRTAVPAGWMPAFGERGFTLAPCSSWAPAADERAPPEAAHGTHGDHGTPASEDMPEQPKHDSNGQPCAFAALGLDLAKPDAEAILAIASHPGVDPAQDITVAIGRGLAAPPPPSTGPPHLA